MNLVPQNMFVILSLGLSIFMYVSSQSTVATLGDKRDVYGKGKWDDNCWVHDTYVVHWVSELFIAAMRTISVYFQDLTWFFFTIIKR